MNPKHLPKPTTREFIDRVVVPALLERFLREHRTPRHNA